MKKKYLLFALFFLLSSLSFAQTHDKNTAITDQSFSEAAAVKTDSTRTAKPQIFERNPLPSGQKISPAIFYVENDQPTDRQAYQRHIQKKSKN